MARGKRIQDKYMICEMCGKPAECTHHWLFGYGVRQLAEEDKITANLCHKCHNLAPRTLDRIHDNPTAEKLSKMYGQALWELERVADGATPEQAREQFIKRYGRSWIWREGRE